MNPTMLLPLNKLRALGSNDIGLLLEGLKSSQGCETNLAKLSDFDNVLTILETTFNANDQPTWLSSISPYANLKIPPTDVLRVVYALASRPHTSNWSDYATLVMGLKTSDDYTKEQSAEYNMDPTKSPLSDRAIRILNRYVHLVQSTESCSDPNLNVLYDRLCALMKDFCIPMYVIQHKDRPGSHASTAPLLKPSASLKRQPLKTSRLRASKRKTPLDASPTKQSMITSFFEPSPVSKRIKPSDEPGLADQCDSTDEDDEDLDIVSDSDRQECSPISHLDTDMELEVNKFRQRGSGENFPLSKTQGEHAHPSTQMSESELFFKSMTSAENGRVSPVPIEKKSQQTADFDPKNIAYSFKVFDEVPLSYAMNPTINHRFTIWRLINFAFYCADRSSLARASDYNSPHHSLFVSYKGIIDVTVDFLAWNLVHELDLSLPKYGIEGNGRECLGLLSQKEIGLVKGCLISNSILFLALLSQLSPFSHDWYDRIIEFTFNGLGSSGKVTPKACFKRDADLISGFSSSRDAGKRPSRDTPCDNTHSMTTRHKICLVVYYYSLFHDNLPDDAQSSTSLLTLVGKRLNSVSQALVRTFLICDDLPACIRHHDLYFSIRLAGVLLSQAVSEVYKSSFAFAGAISSREATYCRQKIDISNLATILSVITKRQVYPDLDSIDNFDGWSKAWLKFNMLTEWLFFTILRINFNNYSRNEDFLRIIQEGCQRADKLRNSIIDEISMDPTTIQKLNTPGPRLEAACREGLNSFRNICLTTTSVDSTLVDVDWEQNFSPRQALNCIYLFEGNNNLLSN